jgi:hypothetical protein
MDLLKKIADTVEMSIVIPDSEKGIATKLITNLEKLSKKYDAFNTLLDKIYTPFSNSEQQIPEESIKKYKPSLVQYKKEIEESTKEIQHLAILCEEGLKEFASDTDIGEILATFENDISVISDDVRILGDVLYKWDDNDFKDMVVKAIENLKKEIGNSRELINDRIIPHINENVLKKSWVQDVGEEMNYEIKDKEPIIKELYKEREQKMKDYGY